MAGKEEKVVMPLSKVMQLYPEEFSLFLESGLISPRVKSQLLSIRLSKGKGNVVRDNTGDSTSTKKTKRTIRDTYRVNHDAKGGMELTDPKPKGHVEDNRSESVRTRTMNTTCVLVVE